MYPFGTAASRFSLCASAFSSFTNSATSRCDSAQVSNSTWSRSACAIDSAMGAMPASVMSSALAPSSIAPRHAPKIVMTAVCFASSSPSAPFQSFGRPRFVDRVQGLRLHGLDGLCQGPRELDEQAVSRRHPHSVEGAGFLRRRAGLLERAHPALDPKSVPTGPLARGRQRCSSSVASPCCGTIVGPNLRSQTSVA